jgi:hypothetical protein
MTEKNTNRYNRSKIYKIVDNTNSNVYIGSATEKTLGCRLGKHKSDHNKYLNKPFIVMSRH